MFRQLPDKDIMSAALLECFGNDEFVTYGNIEDIAETI
jgi:hypothetical protein